MLLKPKMHLYSYDVPNFIKRHKTLEFLSEEEGESLHNTFNMENRILASVQKPGERMHLGLKRHALRAQCDKSLIAPKKRLCLCSENGKDNKNRVFLKEGQTQCDNCSASNI